MANQTQLSREFETDLVRQAKARHADWLPVYRQRTVPDQLLVTGNRVRLLSKEAVIEAVIERGPSRGRHDINDGDENKPASW